MFIIDGIVCDAQCKVERIAEIKPSEISGILLDKSFFNDVLGTYMEYSISVLVPLFLQDKYCAIYEALTSPVDGHAFVLPYNQGLISITGRVENVQDERIKLPGGMTYWKNTSFTVIANHPSKTMGLSAVISRGRAPLPEVAAPTVGDLYEYTSGGWARTAYADVDDTQF